MIAKPKNQEAKPEMNFQNYWAKLTQKEISNFSVLVQICPIFLIIAKYFFPGWQLPSFTLNRQF